MVFIVGEMECCDLDTLHFELIRMGQYYFMSGVENVKFGNDGLILLPNQTNSSLENDEIFEKSSLIFSWNVKYVMAHHL